MTKPTRKEKLFHKMIGSFIMLLLVYTVNYTLYKLGAKQDLQGDLLFSFLIIVFFISLVFRILNFAVNVVIFIFEMIVEDDRNQEENIEEFRKKIQQEDNKEEELKLSYIRVEQISSQKLSREIETVKNLEGKIKTIKGGANFSGYIKSELERNNRLQAIKGLLYALEEEPYRHGEVKDYVNKYVPDICVLVVKYIEVDTMQISTDEIDNIKEETLETIGVLGDKTVEIYDEFKRKEEKDLQKQIDYIKENVL